MSFLKQILCRGTGCQGAGNSRRELCSVPWPRWRKKLECWRRVSSSKGWVLWFPPCGSWAGQGARQGSGQGSLGVLGWRGSCLPWERSCSTSVQMPTRGATRVHSPLARFPVLHFCRGRWISQDYPGVRKTTCLHLAHLTQQWGRPWEGGGQQEFWQSAKIACAFFSDMSVQGFPFIWENGKQNVLFEGGQSNANLKVRLK